MVQLSEETKKVLVEILKREVGMRTIGTDTAARHYEWLVANNLLEPEYKNMFRESRTVMTRQAIKAYSISGIETVIDVGCGNGSSSVALIQELQPKKLILVDSQPEAIEAAKQYFTKEFTDHSTRLEYVLGSLDNLENLGLPPADLVLMRAVIRFVRHADRPKVFRQACATLKDNGKFLFDLPLRDNIDFTEIEGTLLPVVGSTLDALYGIPGMRNAIDYTGNMSRLKIPQELEAARFRNQLFTYFRAYIGLSDVLDKAGGEFSYITQCPELQYNPKAKEELISAKEELMRTLETRAKPYFTTQQTAAQLFVLATR